MPTDFNIYLVVAVALAVVLVVAMYFRGRVSVNIGKDGLTARTNGEPGNEQSVLRNGRLERVKAGNIGVQQDAPPPAGTKTDVASGATFIDSEVRDIGINMASKTNK